ncbi:hypothetical protein ACFL7M_00790, partial [Thermodesulfobacteriota bacterium]
IDGVLFDRVPASKPSIPEELLQHGCVAGVMKGLIDIVSDEIEKSGEMGISETGIAENKGHDVAR